MKLSIWQQWSSNHSSSYTIVGMFETEEQAQNIGTELKELLLNIRAWWREHPEKLTWKSGPDATPPPLSPPERSAETKYGIDWEQSIDWLRHDWNQYFKEFARRTPDERVYIVDRLVSVRTPFDATNQTGSQFAKLMQATGAQVVYEIMNTRLWMQTAGASFDMTITSVDAQIARTLFAWLGAYVRHPDQAAMPWAIYHVPARAIKPLLTAENYLREEAIWLRDEFAWRAYSAQLPAPKLRSEIEKADLGALHTQPEELREYISMLRDEAAFTDATIERGEHEIHLKDAKGSTALFPLIRWLGTFECEVSYELKQAYDNSADME